MLACGDTFYASDDEDVEPHLQVIVTEPHHGEVITVSITSRRAKSETLVILRVGDHPFIKWDSVAAYRYAQIRKISDIEALLKGGTAARREKMADHLVSRLRAGVRESDFTPNEVRNFYLDLELD